MSVLMEFCLKGGDPRSAETRRRCGTLAGGVGVLLNVLLFAGKLLAGLLTSSVAVIADAVNNLSDAATSVVTLVGFRLAGQEADADHPFGHGRIEYISGLVVALAILLMGIEVGRSALEALFRPSTVQATPLSVGILVAAIAVKLWLFWFNRTLGRTIDSAAMEATAADSLSDAASTAVVLLTALAGPHVTFPIDALAGLLVAALILKTGWEAARDTLDPLLGRPMDPKLAADIDALVLGHDKILGIHDLIYHDYGPGRAMMSLHAEVSADEDLLEIHDIIDHIERELKTKHRIETVIHMDPVVCDERTAGLRTQVAELARTVHPALSIHDFRVTAGPIHTNLLFDLVVPYNCAIKDDEVAEALTAAIKGLSDRYYPVIEVEHSFVEDCGEGR